MNIATYARRNLFRRVGRTILTILAVAVTTLIFCVLRTAVIGWSSGAEAAASDRLATRHRVSLTMQLPKHYIDQVRAVPGVKSATYANWFGAKDPQKRVPFFAGFAADQDSWFEVQDEMKIPADQLAKWKQTPNGAVIGDLLAKAFKAEVGSRIVITSDIYPGDWQFEVVGIYTATAKNVDRTSFLLRWDYLNNDPRAAFGKDQLGWMMSRVTDSTHSVEISRAIDARFEERDDQTSTMTERAFQLSFLAGFSAIFKAFDYISLVILAIMTLILANTIAMNVRERTHEYGVLRAIGFSPSYILGFILGESLLIATVGGVVGVLLDVVLINHGLGPVIESSGAFPGFHTPAWVLAAGLVLAAVLGTLAGTLPAIRASRLKVTDALRRLD